MTKMSFRSCSILKHIPEQDCLAVCSRFNRIGMGICRCVVEYTRIMQKHQQCTLQKNMFIE